MKSFYKTRNFNKVKFGKNVAGMMKFSNGMTPGNVLQQLITLVKIKKIRAKTSYSSDVEHL